MQSTRGCVGWDTTPVVEINYEAWLIDVVISKSAISSLGL